jgi:ring-1,2-phenylacetyl-CoA epoxidase subunit PaaE
MALLRTTPGTRPVFHPLEVTAVEPVAEHAVSIAFAVPPELAATYLDYKPGQYVTIRAEIAGEQVRQSYSLWTPPSRARAESQLRIAAAAVQGGRMSPWLAGSVRAGDRLDVLPPLGDFTYAVGPGPQEHVAVVGGSGITPVLAIAAAILEEDGESTVDLILANRTRASTVLAGALVDLEMRSQGRLQVTHVLSREDRPQAQRGRITTEHLAELDRRHPQAQWWLCGPEGLIDLAVDYLAEAGVDGERIHRERFTSTGPVDPRPGQRN